MSRITFVIPNRGGKHIDFVINQLRKYYPDEKYLVVNQEDDEPFKRGPLFNIAYHYITTDYICFIDNDIFFKSYIDLVDIYEKNKCQVLMPFNIIEQVNIVNDNYIATSVGKKIVISNDHSFGPRGGVSFVSKQAYKDLNGFSTLLMGYGYEDNEFATRCDKNKFINTDNVICHITHPTRDVKNLHQQLNCVLFNNEGADVHGGISTTEYRELYKKMENDVLYIGATDISTSQPKAKELLELHKPENIRKACEYMCDYYIKKYVTSDYILLGVPKHMNIGDTLIWEAEKELLDKLPYKRLATFFFGTYMSHIKEKISDEDIIIFSGGGYLNDIWGGTLEYIYQVLDAFPNNKVIFLPNSVYKKNSNNIIFNKILNNFKKRKHKPVILSREYQSIKNSRRIFGATATHILAPDVVLTWDVMKYLEKNGLSYDTGSGTLFIDRDDRERISNKTFDYDCKSDWPQMKDRPSYADVNMRCIYWEKDVKDRLIIDAIRWVNKFGVVYSNRMHGSILSWLLGKETYLINNSYGKSKSLYETWLLDDNKFKIIE